MCKLNGFHARLEAILHKIFHPNHRLIWRTQREEICSGDIVCDTCNKIYWCRWYDNPSESWAKYEKLKTENNHV